MARVISFFLRILKFYAQRQLYRAAPRNAVRRYELAGDDAKCTPVGQTQGGVGKVDIIKNIEQIRRDYDTDSLVNVGSLSGREVEIPKRQPSHRVGPPAAPARVDQDRAELLKTALGV